MFDKKHGLKDKLPFGESSAAGESPKKGSPKNTDAKSDSMDNHITTLRLTWFLYDGLQVNTPMADGRAEEGLERVWWVSAPPRSPLEPALASYALGWPLGPHFGLYIPAVNAEKFSWV